MRLPQQPHLGSVAQFVGDFDLIFDVVKIFDEIVMKLGCGRRKSQVFDRSGVRAMARKPPRCLFNWQSDGFWQASAKCWGRLAWGGETVAGDGFIRAWK